MDIISNFMTVIRNGCRARKQEITVQYSKLKCEILRLLLEEGYINNFEIDNPDSPHSVKITLKYDDKGNPVLHNIVRVSKPGRRVYLKSHEIKPVHEGLGVAIISTSTGILSDRQARRKKVGGEYVGYIY
ncbi:MAG TPA: 30S ribosomal protein S8 [bacterium (Candidatus Stahlbacteria)]|nr:30S ribosomal protein S8 [Candidatus Stahlbacteria bacterium]